jgi:hypothetical protein
MRACLLTAGLALLAGAAGAQPTDMAQAGANIRAHITFLASDLLKGREAGSPEYDIAANYVASQMAQLGLKPMGDAGSYFQHVPLFAYRATDSGNLALHGANGSSPLVFGQDYVVGGSPLGKTVQLDAPLVFAGFGVVAPEHGRDDYKGLDVRGKIVVLLPSAPKNYQTEERAYYGNTRNKMAEALAHGAAGVVSLNTPQWEKMRPVANSVRQYQNWGMTWKAPDGKPFTTAAIPSLGIITVAGAQKLFAGAPVSYAKIVDAAETPAAKLSGFALPRSLHAELHSELKTVDSENVVGVLPGSDPTLKSEYVVLSAHLDHIGITPPVKGDSINNGAMDNASGVATTLEVARMFRLSGKPPRRSVLFLVDTAEEKGLLGAEYFARYPTVPRAAIASDVDIDMPILTYDFTDVTAFGADRSSIGPAVQRAAARLNVALSPDPMPDEGVFTRSDHYRFVEQGVPAVFLTTGFANGGEAATHDFLDNNYHKPSDDLSLPFRWDAAAKFARLNYEVSRELADEDARSSWNRGDFFGDRFAPH